MASQRQRFKHFGAQITHLENETVFDIEKDLATVAVVLDENVERVGTVDPTEESRVWRQRDDRVLDDGEVALEGLGVDREESVDKTKELHDSLVLAEILVSWKGSSARARRVRGREAGEPLRRKL